MNYIEIAHTMNALGAIAIILVGSVHLKRHLKRVTMK